ncbi:MAG: ATP-binding protein [Pseudomonas marincola]
MGILRTLTINRLGKGLISSLILVVLITIGTNWFMVREVLTLSTAWSDKEHSIVQKQAYLSVLRGSIGYGGMIHNFKNYILRNDKHYLLNAYRSMLEAKIIVNGYRELGISAEERTALKELGSVIEKYRIAMARAEALFAVNSSIVNIDNQISIDDKPALRALEKLTGAVADLRQSKTDVISGEISSLVNTVTLAAIGIGLLLLIMILGLTWFLRFRLINPLDELVVAFNHVDLNDPGLIRLPSTGVSGDELAMMANAGNRFLDTLETHLAERQQVRDQLLGAKNEAENANLAKSNFLSTMSHEIRTPLNGVLGLAQLLTDTKLDKDQRRKVDTILSSGQTLLAIINDVLDMSKIEAGAIELENSPFSLGDLLSTITTPFQSLADDKGLQLIVKDLGARKPVLKGDPVRLRQILWNILSNAIKFTEEGSVTLTIADIDIAHNSIVEKKTYGLHFTISDTGAGIAPDRIDAIFGAFTQEDNTITRKHGGTGLGLSIVKQLTELMGGTINAESQMDNGTVFNVYLPFDTATDEEANAISLRKVYDSSQKTEPLNVLVAEDNEVNAVIARAFLEKFGHSVRHVENGKLAVEAAKEGWADLILMDVHMPEMNGIDATKAIRLTELGRTLPIIGLTAEAFAERHVLFKEAGMIGVLTKPFTEQQLADTLATHRLVERRRVPRIEKTADTSASNLENVAVIEDENPSKFETLKDTPPASDRPSPGDEVKLTALRNQLDSKTVSTLLKETQRSLRKQLDELRQGVLDTDSKQIHGAAHAIRGTSGSMFAMHVSNLAAKIEESSTDIDTVQQLLAELEFASKDALEWWHKQDA